MTYLTDSEARDSSDSATSPTLLLGLKNRENHAWKCLTELYAPLIYHWCRKSGMNADDAADLVQDVFRTLVIHINRFEKSSEEGSFRAWLWTITRNRIRDFYRARGRRIQGVGGSEAHLVLQNLLDIDSDDHADSDLSATGSLACRAMNTVRSEVQEHTWVAFWRTTIDEIDPAAVAQELDISIESVWQARSRVLRRLRQLLMP